jgi:hypothetical protein
MQRGGYSCRSGNEALNRARFTWAPPRCAKVRGSHPMSAIKRCGSRLHSVRKNKTPPARRNEPAPTLKRLVPAANREHAAHSFGKEGLP